VTFALASGLLALLFGVALGNVVRGVPLGRSHYFEGTFTFCSTRIPSASAS